jgi:hypothetical protein
MANLALATQALGLESIDPSLPPAQQCAMREQVIDTCIELPQMFWLRIGQELIQLKKTMQFTYSSQWPEGQKARGWNEYLKMRFESQRDPEKSIGKETATGWMQWAVLHEAFQIENEARRARNQLPLPLPSSISQLRPYRSVMRRVDDYEYPPGNQPGAPAVPFEMEPPYAADQSEVIAAWESAWETIPPDKRIRKGEPVPPSKAVSEQYFCEREGLRQLKAREEREMEESKKSAVSVGQKLAEPGTKTPSPSAKPKPKPKPKKSEAELEAERRAYQLQQDARDYRLKLMNLQQSAESLQAFLKNTLAREGSETYLTQMRGLELGIYSVGKDIELLRGAVTTLQGVFRLATEPYTPPTPISREDAAADAVVDV